MSDDIARRDQEPGPDGIRGRGSIPDDADTEGHKRPVSREAGPDDGLKRSPASDDAEEPGPDDVHFSDRNRKTGIVPVEW